MLYHIARTPWPPRQTRNGVMAGLVTARRVYPTCGAQRCATRASPSCGAIHVFACGAKDVDARDISAFTRFFRRAMRGHDGIGSESNCAGYSRVFADPRPLGALK